MNAANFGNVEAVRVLLSRGADIKAGEDFNGKRGWPSLVFAARNQHADVVSMLVNHDADLETRHKHGLTALMLAAGASNVKAVEILLRHSPKLEAKNDDDQRRVTSQTR